MFKRRLLALSMAGLLCLSTGICTAGESMVFAAVATQKNTNQDTKAELEQAIVKVKKRVNIPKEYTEFNYYFNKDNSGKTYYNLQWRDKDNKGSAEVTADANGNIYDYQYFSSKEEKEIKLNYLKSELEEDALKAVEKINPVTKGHLKLVSSGYNGRYQNSYQYKFGRIENGVGMNNTISVSISADDKHVVSYDANWLFDTKIPENQPKITKNQAKEKIKKDLKMELKYLSAYSWDDDHDKMDKKVYLAYVPTLDYIAIDANTGKTYLDNEEWVTRDNGFEKGMMADAATAEENAAGDTLTPEEVKAIDVLDNLIDQKTAIAKITKNASLLLDKKAVAITASLRLYDEDYYWQLSFRDPREPDYEKDDYYRAYASATIDAKTGEILSYHASMDDTKKPSKMLNEEKCQSKFEEFVKTQNTERLKNSKLDEIESDHRFYTTDKETITDGYSIRYYRVNEGVPYEDNGIYGSVDRNTGKIYSYSFDWDEDVKFESPKNAISSEKAIDCYLNLDGFGLIYEDNMIHQYDKSYEKKTDYFDAEDAYSVAHEIRLVYNISNIEYGLISPFTGKEIDDDGKEVIKKTPIETYSDVKGNPYERSILLLSDTGLGYENTKFEPDAYITSEQMIKFMQAVGLYGNMEGKEVLTDKYVTREQAAMYIIYCSDLDEIAKLKDIFKTGYSDETSITADKLGAVALCKGLSILQFGKDNTFGPQEKLTRAEAAKLAMDICQQ